MNGECIFCSIAAGSLPAEIVYQDEHCLAFLDIQPASRGHTLLIPRRHQPHIEELPAETTAHLMAIATRIAGRYREQGYALATNLLLNNGKASGQHVPHVHWHIVPRRHGDAAGVYWRHATRFINPWSPMNDRYRLAQEAAALRSLLGGLDGSAAASFT